jgi:excisionase family DNA binding protein
MGADGRMSKHQEPTEDAGSEDLSGKRIFTTGEAAAVCKVSQQTIIRCFDAGRLTGFRVPGSRFRRIPREELIRFMKANDIPLSNLEGGRKRVLIVDDDPQIVETYLDLLARDARLEIRSAGNGYDAGLLTESFRPHLILLDYMLPDINGTIVCQRVKGNPALAKAKVLCVSGAANPEEVRELMEAGADGFLRKPFSIEDLTRRVHELLGIAEFSGIEHDR